MCWKYEDEYKKCFDHLFFKDPICEGEEFLSDSLITLLEEYGVEIVDVDIFKEEFFTLLSAFHALRIIRPLRAQKEITRTVYL